MADNPIGKLNEYSAKHLSSAKIVDKYVDAGSPQQGPKFICNMTLESYKGRGEGRSKKLAKTEAARDILTQILSGGIGATSTGATPAGATPMEDIIDGVDSSPSPSTTNAKSSLQELCQKNRLSIPEYKVTGKTGQDHQLQFTVLCTVKDTNNDIVKQVYGNAIGKKQAEIDAATKMKPAIEDLLANMVDGINNTGVSLVIPRSGQSKDSTPALAMELDSEVVPIDELLSIIIAKNFDTPELLIETSEPAVSTDLSTIKYLCIAQARHSNPRSVKCSYELSSYPIAAQGIGSTEDEAKREALLNLIGNIGMLLNV